MLLSIFRYPALEDRGRKILIGLCRLRSACFRSPNLVGCIDGVSVTGAAVGLVRYGRCTEVVGTFMQCINLSDCPKDVLLSLSQFVYRRSLAVLEQPYTILLSSSFLIDIVKARTQHVRYYPQPTSEDLVAVSHVQEQMRIAVLRADTDEFINNIIEIEVLILGHEPEAYLGTEPVIGVVFIQTSPYNQTIIGIARAVILPDLFSKFFTLIFGADVILLVVRIEDVYLFDVFPYLQLIKAPFHRFYFCSTKCDEDIVIINHIYG